MKSQSLSALKFDNRGFPRHLDSLAPAEIKSLCVLAHAPGPVCERFTGTHDDRCQ